MSDTQFNEYQILETDTTEGLTVKVKEAMILGWQPIGGVSMCYIPPYSFESEDERSFWYTQAMVRWMLFA
jgi:hypothetical protein